ncbi:MAG: GGDEF domain-containing protein [Thermoanaerobacteraceae bacterium]|nr:GGDEF domain-containing protein [Thermoanaerobacteraceae bacterium]
MEEDIKKIIEERQFTIFFQPIVSLSDGKVVGYEALTRGPEGSFFYNPEILFGEAKKYDLLWELEMVTRIKAIEIFNSFKNDKLLFLNVDPEIIKDEHFIKGTTREVLQFYGTSPSNLIFEITEKTAINDYKTFKDVIDNYKIQGYKIAIDDVGAGYSGLYAIAEIKPCYVKIDMSLIRDIDKDNFKKAIVKALVEFANNTNIKLIAEGIETIDELYAIIEIGIPLAQGFLLAKPADKLYCIEEEIKKMIVDRNAYIEKLKFASTFTVSIGEIARRDKGVSPFARGSEVEKIFANNPNLQGLTVVNEGKISGLIMRKKFFSHIGTQYGWAIYMKRPIYKLMDPNPLVFDYNIPISDVVKSVTTREEDKLYDYIIIEKEGFYYGIVPVISLLEKSMQLELNIAKYSNPLTGLPGNLMIEEKIREIITQNDPFSLLYFDLNNFKAYNDIYGFEKGDKVIKYTANIIDRHLYFYKDSFLGHIGGDDYVAILKTYEVEDLCKNIVEEFDYNIVRFYSDSDVKRGYIHATDRLCRENDFPIMGISIAVVNNMNKKFATIDELSEIASQVKKKCKLFNKSYYIIESF